MKQHLNVAAHVDFIHSRGFASSAPIEVQKLITSQPKLYAGILLKAARFVLAGNRGHVQNISASLRVRSNALAT